jgi:hypothetical protein
VLTITWEVGSLGIYILSRYNLQHVAPNRDDTTPRHINEATPQGDHTPLRFVTTCDNGVFNEGYLCTSQYFFPALFVDRKLL